MHLLISLVSALTATTSHAQIKAAELRRDFILASPELNLVLTQTTSSRGEVYFEACHIDFSATKRADQILRTLNQGGVACETLANVRLDATDERAMASLRRTFVGHLRGIVPPLIERSTRDGFGWTVVGALATATFVPSLFMTAVQDSLGWLNPANAWKRRAFFTGWGLIGVIYPVYSAGTAQRRVAGLKKARAVTDVIAENERFTRTVLPMLNADGFYLFREALIGALRQTAAALTIRE